MSRVLRRGAPNATQRLRRLDRGAGPAELLRAARDPSVEVARRALGWLAHEGGPPEREALRELVWSCDPALAKDVAGTLRALGDDRTVDAACNRLHSGPTAERCRAARVLERLADRRARPALCTALADEDASVRAAVLDALARHGPDAHVAACAARLVTDVDPEVRRRAVRATGRVSSDSAPAIRLALRDPAPAVRREAAVFAARLDATDLAALLSDADPFVRAAAASNSGRGSEAALAQALRSDPHPVVRLAAAQTLGLLGGPVAEASLVAAALDDVEATVRARALRLARETLSYERLVASLRGELASESAHRRQMALRALAKLSVRIAEADALRLAHDPEPGVRLALAHVATATVVAPNRVLSALADDGDATVRHAAAVHRARQAR
jgi:HEAT repeat protein